MRRFMSVEFTQFVENSAHLAVEVGTQFLEERLHAARFDVADACQELVLQVEDASHQLVGLLFIRSRHVKTLDKALGEEFACNMVNLLLKISFVCHNFDNEWVNT